MIAVLAIALLAVIVLPQFWVRFTLDRHGKDRPDFPGTGGELARHLLDRYELGHVKVERTDAGDHYDPDAKAVRLSPRHHDGRSLSAVAVAAHEVGHAIQHGTGDRMLELRQKLARLAVNTDRLAGVFFIGAPILAVLVRTPLALAALVAVGIGLLAVRVVVTLVTLPVEYDASFGKALPILKDGAYIGERDLPGARAVLRAAAFSYVAGALIALVNLARWIRLIR